MHPAMEDYLNQAERLDAVITARPDADWTAPSPCAGWSAAAVLDHVVSTQRDFLAARGATLEAAAVGTPAEIWAAHVTSVAAVGANESFIAAQYDGFFGPTTVADTLRDFYGFDMIVHRWDVGRALGVEVTWDEQEMDLLESAVEGFGEALYSEGVCADPVGVPEDASRQDRLLGRLGRPPV